MLLARILWILAYVLWDTSMYTMWYWHSYCVTLTCALCDTDMLVVWHSLVHCVTMTCALYDTDMYIVWHSHVNCVVLTCILCDTAMCVVSHWHVYCVTQTVYSVGFLTSNYFRVFLDSKYENSQLRSEKAGFHFAVATAKLHLLRRMETAISEFLRSVWKELDTSSLVPECSLFLEVTFAISNHRITYNSTLATL